MEALASIISPADDLTANCIVMLLMKAMILVQQQRLIPLVTGTINMPMA